MRISTPTPWLNNFVLTRAIEGGRLSEFYRAARSGQFLRLTEGVYVQSAAWAAMGEDARFLARVHAVSLSSRAGILFSHFSAAALWRLPILGQWPSKPEVTVGKGAVGPSRSAFTARQYAMPLEHDTIDGIRVTSLARTTIDIGRGAPLPTAVAMMDAALSEKDARVAPITARLTHEQLGTEFARIDSRRGRNRCRDAIELADGLSGSPGESLSRVNIHLLGLPAPVLQQEFSDAHGLIGYVDFWWPKFGLIGEFDGKGKYLRDEMLAGRSIADVVLAEKRREDRLRALGPRVTRWGWDVARSLPMLSRQLNDAGLR